MTIPALKRRSLSAKPMMLPMKGRLAEKSPG
jgi:hypothetical protein